MGEEASQASVRAGEGTKKAPKVGRSAAIGGMAAAVRRPTRVPATAGRTDAKGAEGGPGRAASTMLAVAGFGFLEAWSQLLFSSSFASDVYAGPLSADQAHLVGSFLAVACALLWAAGSRLGSLLPHRKEWLWALGSIGALASCGLVALGMAGSSSGLAHLALNGVATVGSIGLLLAWCLRLAPRGGAAMVCLMGAGAMLGGVLYGVADLLPAPAGVVLMVLCPLVSVTALRPDADGACAGHATQGVPGASAAPHATALLLWFALVALSSFSSGVILATDMDYRAAGLAASPLPDAVGRILVMGSATALAALSLGGGRRLLGFCVSIAAMAASFVMMVFGARPFVGAAPLLARIGSETIRLMVLGMIAVWIARDGRRLCRSLALLFAFQFLGTALGQAVVGLSGDHSFLGVVLLVDLVATAMVLMGAMVLSYGSGFAGPAATPAEPAPVTRDERLDEFARTFHLSGREREVLGFWVSGHDSAFIEQELTISKHTVKTHIQNIYAKTGAKNKQELIGLFEDEGSWRPHSG